MKHARTAAVSLGVGSLAALIIMGCGDDGSRASELDPAVGETSAALTPRTTVVALHSKKCVGVEGASTTNGAPFVQAECVSGQASQLFDVKDVGGGAVQIVAVSSGKCLDVYQAKSENLTPIIQWECNGTYPNQRFSLVPLSDGTVQIKSTHTGKCVDVYQGRQESGTRLIQWDCVAAYSNQHFTLQAPPATGPKPSPTPTTTASTPPPPPPAAGIATETSVGFRGDPATLKKTLPAGASLDGNVVYVTQDGVVFDGYDFREKVFVVKASNVTFRNSLFTAPNGAYWTVLLDSGKNNLTVEDSTFDGQKRNNSIAAAIWSYTGSTTIRRNKIIDWPSDMLNIRGGLVEQNWLAGGSYASGAHADAIYVPTTSSAVEVRYNYVDFRKRSDAPQGTNNCVRITNEGGGGVNGVKLHDNVFRGGGGYTLSVDSVARNVSITNNRLEDTTEYGNGNYYFYPSYPPDLVFTGNTDYLTGAPVAAK